MMNPFHYLLSDFPLAQANFKALADVKTRTFDFGNSLIKVQFNPARAASSGAKLDAKTIEARPCFLCKKNRPEVQKSIDYNERFEICINPFPILDGHLTIISKTHTAQQIIPYYNDMLALAKDLEDYVILYNGAKCGASAPDHQHFQAVFKGQLPLEEITPPLTPPQGGEPLAQVETRRATSLRPRCLILESNNAEEAQQSFQQLLNDLQQNYNIDETMLNVFCWYASASLSNLASASLSNPTSASLSNPTSTSLSNRWITAVFPRKVHRPSQFFAEGEEYMMISPGAIDMAGVLVLPRKEDFEKITKEIIEDVMAQVSLSIKN